MAERFKKRHNSVLRAIDNQRKIALVEDRKLYRESSYVDAKGEARRMYLMNRQGYELLVMGFTGEEAAEWKLKYSDAFTAMENFIREKSSQEWLETREAGKKTRRMETDAIKELVEYAEQNGSKNASRLYMTYTRLANSMAGIKSRDGATTPQLNTLAMMENIISHMVRRGISDNTDYHQIYKDCKSRLNTVATMAFLEESVGV